MFNPQARSFTVKSNSAQNIDTDGNFFLSETEGPRTEDAARCTDCKAHRGNVI